MIVWLDLETYSPIPISAGAHKYAEQSEVLLISYAVDDEPARVVDATADKRGVSDFLARCTTPGAQLCAHNASFDRAQLAHSYPYIDAFATADHWVDSMIVASTLGYPASLGKLCEVLGLPSDKAKDAAGKRLIRLFSLPQADGRRVYPQDAPEKWAQFIEYARLDVEAMRECVKRLPTMLETTATWNQIWTDWRGDQVINDRGMAIDLAFVECARRECAQEAERLNERIRRETDGAVTATTQLRALASYLSEHYGLEVISLTASVIASLLNDPTVPAGAKSLLECRRLASLASVKKYDVLAQATGSDGRLRGCLQFMGAARTGRFSGRLFQPQNLPRGDLKPAEVLEAVDAFKAGAASLLYPSVSDTAKSCLRACIVAPKGRRLVVADLSNIEGRVLAWLAGEAWKIKAFRDFDAGHGADLYKATYSRTFAVPVDAVTKKQRQVGKVMELALGYQGGVGAFTTFATAYRIDLEGEFSEQVMATAKPEQIDDAMRSWSFMSAMPDFKPGLSRRAWTACRIVQQAWRNAHPAITAMWDNVDQAVAVCLNTPGHVETVGRVQIFKAPWALCIRLPSGRVMVYPEARAPRDNERASMVFKSVMGTTWSSERTYSGKLVENITQAVARDILVSSMAPIERAGYEIVLSVHDEYITEAPDTDEYNAEALANLMATAPQWAEGLPLAAAGFVDYRYKKD